VCIPGGRFFPDCRLQPTGPRCGCGCCKHPRYFITASRSIFRGMSGDLVGFPELV
jgi:hypothetical protein